jgi:hypothetical protein
MQLVEMMGGSIELFPAANSDSLARRPPLRIEVGAACQPPARFSARDVAHIPVGNKTAARNNRSKPGQYARHVGSFAKSTTCPPPTGTSTR